MKIMQMVQKNELRNQPTVCKSNIFVKFLQKSSLFSKFAG